MNFSVEKILKLLRKYFLLILAVSLICAAFMYWHTIKTAVPVYTAYTEMYVNTIAPEGDKYLVLGSSNYTSTYIEILKTVQFCKIVYQGLSDDYKKMTSPAGIYASMHVARKNDTDIITVNVHSTNSKLAMTIAESVWNSAGIYLNEKFGVDSVVIVENARPSGVTAAAYKKNVMIGFAAGAFLTFFAVFVKDLYDYRVRSADEISERYNLPILGRVPTFSGKKGIGTRRKGYDQYVYGRSDRRR